MATDSVNFAGLSHTFTPSSSRESTKRATRQRTASAAMTVARPSSGRCPEVCAIVGFFRVFPSPVVLMISSLLDPAVAGSGLELLPGNVFLRHAPQGGQQGVAQDRSHDDRFRHGRNIAACGH